MGKTGVEVGTGFGFHPAVARPCDMQLETETDMKQAFNSGYDVIFADPLLEVLMERDSSTRFVPLPHVAISSKICWDNSPRLVGNEALSLVKTDL